MTANGEHGGEARMIRISEEEYRVLRERGEVSRDEDLVLRMRRIHPQTGTVERVPCEVMDRFRWVAVPGDLTSAMNRYLGRCMENDDLSSGHRPADAWRIAGEEQGFWRLVAEYAEGPIAFAWVDARNGDLWSATSWHERGERRGNVFGPYAFFH